MAMGGTVPEEGHEKNPSVLSRVLDVVSRPNYAIANAAKSLVDDDKSGNIFSEAAQGFTGKDKTSFSTVLDEAGVKNKWVRGIGGLALDVGLDPTTYVGVGLLGKGAKAAHLAQGGKIFEKASKTALATEKALAAAGKSSVAKKAVAEALEQAAITGKAVKKSQVIEDAVVEAAYTIGKAEEAAHLAKTPKTGLGIRVLGRETPLQSKLAGEALERAKTRIVEGTPLRNLSTKALFQGTNPIKQAALGVSVQTTKHDLSELKNILTEAGADKVTREQMTKYLRGGIKHSDPDTQAAMDTILAKLDDIKQERVHVLGKTMDLDDPTPYLPTVYRKKGHMRQFSDPAEAAKKGYKEVDDIGDVLTYVVVDHQREMGLADFGKKVSDEFGIKIEGEGKKLPRMQRKLLEKNLLTNKVKNPYIPKDTYFDPKIADGLNTMQEFFESDTAMGDFMRGFDRLQGKWKFLVTVPNPGFQTRNLLSDSWMNLMNGLHPLDRSYKRAFDTVIGPHLPGPLKNVKDWSMKVKGTTITRSDLEAAYDARGLRSGYFKAELGELTPKMEQGVLTKAGTKLKSASEVREDFTRFANFIHSTERALKQGKSLEKAFDEAADAVRTYNFDYSDFTPFETKVMKRIIPFYSWMRKNVPAQLTLLATQPGKVAYAPKGIRAIQELMGVEPGDEPMPGLGNLIPQYMEEAGGFLLSPGVMGKSGPTLGMPDLPYNDLGRYFEGLDQVFEDPKKALQPLNQIMSGTSPFVRLPFELATGREVFGGGRNITDYGDYFAKQIPSKRYTSDVILGTETQPESLSERALQLVNPFKAREVKPYQMQSELRRQQDRYDATIGPIKKRAMEEWLKRNAG